VGGGSGGEEEDDSFERAERNFGMFERELEEFEAVSWDGAGRSRFTSLLCYQLKGRSF
jgi:hypothetical protein